MHFISKFRVFLKDKLQNHQAVHHTLGRVKYLPKYWLPKRVSIVKILENYSINNSNVCFVQIGANDGIDRFTDLRRHYRWHSILVEPQTDVFEELKQQNKIDHDVFFENVAISNETTAKKLYKLSLSSAPWVTGLASFDKEHIVKHVRQGGSIIKQKGKGLRFLRTQMITLAQKM